ncbi:MAG: S-layer homology domain-containing protein, partial [Synergistaceae bacterium]|nr:S-layer homology domain-containing protein [Synergistaceae bacterium]
YWHVQAKQKWTKKFGTFLRYTRADWDTAGQDTATEWGAGITYQYSPAIAFMLAYDSVDYGKGGTSFGRKDAPLEGKDNLIIFRTTVRF